MRLAFVDDCRTPVSTMSTPCEQVSSVVENSWKLPNMNHIDLTWFDSTSIVDGLFLSIYIYIYNAIINWRMENSWQYKVGPSMNDSSKFSLRLTQQSPCADPHGQRRRCKRPRRRVGHVSFLPGHGERRVRGAVRMPWGTTMGSPHVPVANRSGRFFEGMHGNALYIHKITMCMMIYLLYIYMCVCDMVVLYIYIHIIVQYIHIQTYLYNRRTYAYVYI